MTQKKQNATSPAGEESPGNLQCTLAHEQLATAQNRVKKVLLVKKVQCSVEVVKTTRKSTSQSRVKI